MASLLKLYPFKYRDPVSGVWTKARYKAALEDIRARYPEWMIDGEPEIRGHIPAASFNPYTARGSVARLDSNVILQPQCERPPAIDRLEALFVACFLRRYITYCARRRRYAAMQGAAALLAEVRNTCLMSDLRTTR
jgi:hypothetical protein